MMRNDIDSRKMRQQLMGQKLMAQKLMGQKLMGQKLMRQKLMEIRKRQNSTILGLSDPPMGGVDQPKYFWSGASPYGLGSPAHF